MLGLLAALLSAAGAATHTVTVTDLAGITRSFRQPVERIVLVRGRDIYELALLLGDELDKRLVAWGPDIKDADLDAWRAFTERFPSLARLPVLGDVFEDAVSAEALLALKPDLVIADVFMRDRGYACVQAMERAGLPLLFLDLSHDPLSGPQRSLDVLGRVLGRAQRAKEVADFVDAEIAAVLTRVAPLTNALPSVYLEAGSAGPERYGASYGYRGGRALNSWGTVLERLHCRNIAADVIPNMGPILPEFLLKEDPDIIVITAACWPAARDSARAGYFAEPQDARRRLTAFTQRPGWPALRAVRERRVYSVFHGSCMHAFGFAAFQQMARWFHPQACADLDPEAQLRLFHERFLPVPYRGVWMLELEEKP